MTTNNFDMSDLPSDFGEKLITTLTEDITALDYDSFTHSDSPDFGYITLPYIDIYDDDGNLKSSKNMTIPILGGYTKTIEYLDSVGIIPRSMSSVYLQNFSIGFSYLDSDYDTSASFWKISAVEYLDDDTIYDFNDEICEIMEKSRRWYIPGESCYTIYTGGCRAYVPTEYNGLVEEILAAADTRSGETGVYD
jgi:hypothetical protein